MRFTQLSFEVIRNYVGMTVAAARDNRYRDAVESGQRALEARETLTAMNPTFTTYKVIGEVGPAWSPGEVDQMRSLMALTEGPKGRLVKSLPLHWAFRRGTPLPAGWTYTGREGEKSEGRAPDIEPRDKGQV